MTPADAKPVDTAPAPDASLPDAHIIDAPKPDAVPIDAPKPDGAVAIDAPIDTPPAPDACASDPVCNNTAGVHCDSNGASVTCSAVIEGCFHVTGEATACADHQTCSDGAGCQCDIDAKCSVGPGVYCDGTGATYTCAADAHTCVVASGDTACPSPDTCQGAAGHGACACPALGDATGDACNMPDQLSCGPDGNVLVCKAVGACTVWSVSTDCASQALSCNNNQCVCPSNNSHNYYVGPNFDRSAAPAGLSPNGLLTANGICTFTTLGQGLFAAASDVLLTSATQVRVVAVALNAGHTTTTATFKNEVFPLVVGNRTILTTYDDPDQGVGGGGFHPENYTISFNSSSVEGGEMLGVAVVVDPAIASGGQTAGVAPGGSASFNGFTVQPTQANIDCPSASIATTQPACPDGRSFGGGEIAVLATGGESHMKALQLIGIASDAVVSDDDTLEQHGMLLGLGLVDEEVACELTRSCGPQPPIGPSQARAIVSRKALIRSLTTHAKNKKLNNLATVTDGAWGTYDSILIDRFGSFHRAASFVGNDFSDLSPNDAFAQFQESEGIGVLIATADQGETAAGVGNRAVFSHLDVRDTLIGYVQGDGAVTLTSDGSAVPNQIIGTVTTPKTGVQSTMGVGMAFGDAVGFADTEDALDFVGAGVFVRGSEGVGVEIENDFFDEDDNGVPSASSVKFSGGEISGHVRGNDCFLLEAPEFCQGAGIDMESGGAVYDKSEDDEDEGFLFDESGDDTFIGGLSLDATVIKDNYGDGVYLFNDFDDDGFSDLYPGVVFQANNVTIQHNGIGVDDGVADDEDIGDFEHDGIHAIQASDETFDPLIVSLTGTLVDANGILGDRTNGIPVSVTRPIHAAVTTPFFSGGNGITMWGGSLWVKSSTISNNVASGISTDNGDNNEAQWSLVNDSIIKGNGADQCASSPTADSDGEIDPITTDTSCRVAAVVIYGSGGFTLSASQVTNNGATGVEIHSSPTVFGIDGDDAVANCAEPSLLTKVPCPLNHITASSVTNNGGSAVREVNAGLIQGVEVHHPGSVLIDGASTVSNNTGDGIAVRYSSTAFIGDVTVDSNGFNSGTDDGDPTNDVEPAPGSGLRVHDGGDAFVNGTKLNGAVFSNNAADGVDLRGHLDGVNFQATKNGIDGIAVDQAEDDRNNGSVAKNVELDHNAVDGLYIIASGETDEPTSQPFDCVNDKGFSLAGDRETVKSFTLIHDNGNNGVTVGSTDPTLMNNDGLDICAQVGDADIYANKNIGIYVAQPAPDNTEDFVYETVAFVLDNDVYQNAKNGFFALPSGVGQPSPAPGTVAVPSFAQNKFHSNGLNQVVFDGGSMHYVDGLFPYNVDSPTGKCDAGANAFYCYTTGGTVGVFAQGDSDVTVHNSEFSGGAAGLPDYGAQAGSLISVPSNCTAITTCP